MIAPLLGDGLIPLPERDTLEMFVVALVLIEALPLADPVALGLKRTRNVADEPFETEKLAPDTISKGAIVLTVPVAAPVPETC